MTNQFSACAVSTCDGNANRQSNGKLGFCSKHYQRYKRHGDPNVIKVVASPVQDRIRDHADYKGVECLTWPFHIGQDGYGKAHPSGGNITNASRLMCIEAYGDPPDPRMHAAHRCGKGHEGCVNPRHLYWATPSRNQRDRLTHGTDNRGEKHSLVKLTEDDVRTIRRLLADMTHREVANAYCVTREAITGINRGKNWSWLN